MHLTCLHVFVESSSWNIFFQNQDYLYLGEALQTDGSSISSDQFCKGMALDAMRHMVGLHKYDHPSIDL